MGRLGATELLIILLVAIPLLILYFLPTIIAFNRRKSNRSIIFIINFLLGWSLIGWIVSLVWALASENIPQTIVVNNNPISNSEEKVLNTKESSYDEKLNNLQKLKDLFDSGVLSEIEFEEQKSQILSS